MYQKVDGDASLNRNILECKFERVQAILKKMESLNRNILECKSGFRKFIKSIFTCLNRNILECKYDRAAAGWTAAAGLNRNILECKFENDKHTMDIDLVLIETYWNVNRKLHQQNRQPMCVLIETYWNVNLHWQGRHPSRYWRLNRNILECKWIPLGDFVKRVSSLNRNILECKFDIMFFVILRVNTS